MSVSLPRIGKTPTPPATNQPNTNTQQKYTTQFPSFSRMGASSNLLKDIKKPTALPAIRNYSPPIIINEDTFLNIESPSSMQTHPSKSDSPDLEIDELSFGDLSTPPLNPIESSQQKNLPAQLPPIQDYSKVFIKTIVGQTPPKTIISSSSPPPLEFDDLDLGLSVTSTATTNSSTPSASPYPSSSPFSMSTSPAPTDKQHGHTPSLDSIDEESMRVFDLLQTLNNSK